MNSASVVKENSIKSNDILDIPQLHKKPFKLRFGKQHDLGRSSIIPSKPIGLLPILTPKFYSKEVQEFEKKNSNSIEKIKSNIDIVCNEGPCEKFKLPKLESHRYGWYHDTRLSDRSKFDNRFHFGIKNSSMVKYRILVLASDKAMGNIKPVQIKPKN